MQTRQRSAKNELLHPVIEKTHVSQKVRKQIALSLPAAEPMQTRQRSKKEVEPPQPPCGLEKEKNPTDMFREITSCEDSSLENSFGSSVHLPFEAQSWFDVRKQLENIVWIQCDNPHCMKWRKVEKEEICRFTGKEDKWFCKFNTDPNFKRCNVPEEDTDFYDKLADRAGLKYIKSELVPGALVWARMTGYCSWPAVVTPDPASDCETGHLEKDYERAEVTHYHVEFLGKPHTHGWVYAKDAHVFTADTVNKQLCAAEKTSRPLCKKTKQKTDPCKEKKNVGKGGLKLERAISEAMALLPSSPDKRLKQCIYLPQNTLPSHHDKITTKHSVTATNSSLQTRKDQAPSNTSFTSFDNALEDKTKEERLMLDVETYKRNERAFEHDVSRFMIRNGLKPCKGPVWQNRRISLFQLFLAVHERGGYELVTQKRWWAAVYRELTETPCHDASSSHFPKLFYHKYLYPYELFIRGQNYEDVLHKNIRETKGHRGKRKTPMSMATGNSVAQNEGHGIYGRKTRCKGTGAKATEATTEHQKKTITKEQPEDDVSSGSLEDMLRALEGDSFLGEDLEELSGLDREIDVTFYDESTPETRGKLILVDVENLPGDACAGREKPSERANEHETSSSSEGSLLHQLEVLQEGMDFIQDNIEIS